MTTKPKGKAKSPATTGGGSESDSEDEIIVMPLDIDAIRKSLKDTHAKIDMEIKANAAQKSAAQRKPKRKRKPPAATGIKKPRRKAKSTKPTETKTLLLEKIKEHNSKAILIIPPNANLKQLETIFANRPIVYKRRPKLSTQERQALQQAKKDGDKALTEKINKLRKANAIKQSQRNDAIIAKYATGNNNPKPPQVKDLKPITKASTRRITPIMMSKAPTRRITPIMIK
tara:strand:- start:4124 stop:4810 length:687 start_codon:yes stop_codon:yes gene_type:complete